MSVKLDTLKVKADIPALKSGIIKALAMEYNSKQLKNEGEYTDIVLSRRRSITVSVEGKYVGVTVADGWGCPCCNEGITGLARCIESAQAYMEYEIGWRIRFENLPAKKDRTPTAGIAMS